MAASASTGSPLVVQAEEQMAAGKAEMGKWTMFSSTDKWEKAAGHFKSAGNFFKAGMKWKEAHDAYMEARGAYIKLKESSEELQMLREAAGALVHCDAKGSAALLEGELVPRLVHAGKLDEVGKLHLQIADSTMEDDVDVALEHFRKAADMFKSAGSKSDAVKAKLKIGEIASEAANYDEAITMFVEAAEARLEKELTRLSARDHFLDAGICVLAKGDLVEAKESMERWAGMDYTFEDSREGRLFSALINIVTEGKPEEFADALFDFDRIKKLSPWRTKILLRVKETMTEAGDAEMEDLS